MSNDPFEIEQQKLLNEAIQVVNEQGQCMKIELDRNSLRSALTACASMISELRTSLLTPRNYYALYLVASQHLNSLTEHIEMGDHGLSMNELYELVQLCGNILPRLYLLIAVGSCYIKSKEIPAKDIFHDLVEMTKGVQHPTRGLFLRSFLSDSTRELLPDRGSEYNRGSTVNDSIDLILTNFTEMNKLWVRMQHGKSFISQARKEAERKQLGSLIGKNLQRLAELEGLTIGIYQSDVLTRILKQIDKCGDVLAQQILMETLILAFSDEYHLRTLPTLLDTVLKLTDGVNIQSIVGLLIERLSAYIKENPSKSTHSQGVEEEKDIFLVMSDYVVQVASERDYVDTPDMLRLIGSLLNMVFECFPGEIPYVDIIFDLVYVHIDGKTRGETSDCDEILRETRKLLLVPMETFQNITTLLDLSNYTKVIEILPYEERKYVVTRLAQNAVDNDTQLTSVEEVDLLLSLLGPLVRDCDDKTGNDYDEDFDEEQNLVASMISLFYNPEFETHINILSTAHEHFSAGGIKRITYTLVPLVFSTLQLIQKSGTQDKTLLRKALKLAGTAVTSLHSAGKPDISFRLYLHAALAAGKLGLPQMSYDFLTKGALTIYDEEIASPKNRFDAMILFVAALKELDCFSHDSYDTLVNQTAVTCSRLLHPEHQARALTATAGLFVSALDYGENQFVEAKLMKDKLSKAAKLVNAMEPDYQELKEELILEMLDYGVYLVGANNLDPTTLSSLITVTKNFFEEGKTSNTSAHAIHLKKTLKRINQLSSENEAYGEVDIYQLKDFFS
eukprot:TRINITY_DN12112_c0_g1_i1.p1 TRINITY_DN12112_c0_g1~~TRINITY_DN12112_c0_g1_i1.p1  ORF type:complete len:789 (-),score=188.49 TRINITY_DN12112_c0_g1_i1:32-2398(-)